MPAAEEICAVVCQALAPPPGLVELKMDVWPVPMQNEAFGQLTNTLSDAVPMVDTCHADAPPVGFVDVMMLPPLPPTTHSVLVGQLTDSSSIALSTPATCQAEAPPVGLADDRTSPLLSTATHGDVPAHPIAVIKVLAWKGTESRCTACHAEVRRAGSVETRMLPASSPARHSELAGQSRLVIALIPSTVADFHAEAPPPGFFETKTIPASAACPPETATHICRLAQDTSARAVVRWTSITCQAAEPPAGLDVVSTSSDVLSW